MVQFYEIHTVQAFPGPCRKTKKLDFDTLRERRVKGKSVI